MCSDTFRYSRCSIKHTEMLLITFQYKHTEMLLITFQYKATDMLLKCDLWHFSTLCVRNMKKMQIWTQYHFSQVDWKAETNNLKSKVWFSGCYSPSAWTINIKPNCHLQWVTMYHLGRKVMLGALVKYWSKPSACWEYQQGSWNLEDGWKTQC